MPAALGRRSGFQLLSWTQDTIVAVPQKLPAPKPKQTLLPLLIVLFLVSYGLMAMLVVEQDRTIGSQRALITSLFSDSTELTTLKGKVFHKQHPQAESGTRSQAQSPSTQVPMTQAPITQAPMTQTPMTQDTPGGNARNSHSTSKLSKPPQRPPLGIADIVDGRRIVKSI